jgi:hypothetical protein
MAAAPPVSGENGGALHSRPNVPPQDSLWKRYSPHHELPVSVTTSAFVHTVFFVLLAFGILGAVLLQPARDLGPPPGGAVIEVAAEGGSQPTAKGKDPGAFPAAGGEAGQNDEVRENRRLDVKIEELSPPPVSPPKFFPELRDQPGARVFFVQGTDAIQKLDRIGADARRKLIQSVQPPEGPSGPKGDRKPGDGPLKIDNSVKRTLRWTLVFNTENGQDYRNQLAQFHAIVAVPEGKEYRVFRDLTKAPPVGKIEDITEIKRIFWVDDKPQSVNSLANEFGIRPPPPHFVAFFPKEFEEKLLQLEKSYRNKPVEQIAETQFTIKLRKGVYEPVVTGQRLHNEPSKKSEPGPR